MSQAAALCASTATTAAAAAGRRSTASPASAPKSQSHNARAGNPIRGHTMAKNVTLRGAPDQTLNDQTSLTSDDVSSWKEIEMQLAGAYTRGRQSST